MILKTFKLILILALFTTTGIGVLWLRSYTPEDLEPASVQCSPDAPSWTANEPLKVMSYNVQYMASKKYIFFYDIDLEDQERVDAVAKADKIIASQPIEKDVYETLDKVAEVIKQENPDIIMLQEINGSDDSRTHYIDQTTELLNRLEKSSYPCQSEAPYWKAEFILHPEILGPVNMKLLTLSKYRIEKSVRHQLPRVKRNFLQTPFYFQRALLETHIPDIAGNSLAVINSHYEAWGAGTGVMQKQLAKTISVLDRLDAEGVPWVFGGDLNLLPPDKGLQRSRILKAGTGLYDEEPALAVLYDKYRAVPPIDGLLSDTPEIWYTHFPNDPTVSAPDRTIDYLFYSDQWSADDAYILQDGTLDISDHLPVIGIYSFD